MNQTSHLRASARWLAAGVGVIAAAYGAYVGITWFRYGDAAPPSPEEQDPLLDRFMPSYDVAERHHVRVAAPAAVTLAAAQEMDLLHSPSVRAIIKARELILGAKPDDRRRPRGLLAEVQSLGWGVLAEVPGREIVVGGVTKPWEANPTFRALPPDEFQGFSEADYVKIVWTLRADPVGTAESIFRTETRVRTTDPAARKVPAVLVLPVARHHLDSMDLARAFESEAERRARPRNNATVRRVCTSGQPPHGHGHTLGGCLPNSERTTS